MQLILESLGIVCLACVIAFFVSGINNFSLNECNQLFVMVTSSMFKQQQHDEAAVEIKLLQNRISKLEQMQSNQAVKSK